jgi:hypothetical protein
VRLVESTCNYLVLYSYFGDCDTMPVLMTHPTHPTRLCFSSLSRISVHERAYSVHMVGNLKVGKVGKHMSVDM